MNDSRYSRNTWRPARRSSGRGGPGVTTLLTLLFVGLKLADQIDWSWWWVLSPIWINCSLTLLMILTMVVIMKHVWDCEPTGET